MAVIALAWKCPIIPAPIIPNFIVLCLEVETMDPYLARVALLILLPREAPPTQAFSNPSSVEVKNKHIQTVENTGRRPISCFSGSA
jgi:hypothetical protein